MIIFNIETIHQKKTSKKSLETKNKKFKKEIKRKQKCVLESDIIKHYELVKINYNV